MLMRKRIRFPVIPTIILIFLVFSSFVYFRFWNFNNRIAFGWDQEQFSFQIKRLLVDHKLLLLGPRISNDRGFFLGPYFYYLLAPFYLVTNLHPSALAIFLIAYNFVFFIGGYIILKLLFNQYTALFFLLLWSINPIIAHYDSVAWNPSVIPIAVLTTFLLLREIYNNNRVINWLLLGFVLGFSIHMHVQFAFIILFTCMALFMMRKHSKADVLRITLFVAPIFLSLIPLIIFDLRHEFLNIKAIQDFFSPRSFNIQSNIFSWAPVFQNVVQPITVVTTSLVTFVFYLVMFVFMTYGYKQKKGFMKYFYASSMMLWLFFPVLFTAYSQRPSEYYFLFLYSFIYLIIADFFYTIKKILFLVMISVILFIANFNLLQFNLKTDYYSLKYKDELIRKLVKRIKGKTFNLSYNTALTTDYGFRYLVDYYQLKPTGNWKDPLVQIQIPADNKSSIKVADMGVIIPKELSY